MRARIAAGTALAALLAFGVPPFLCMGLDVDAIGYDVQARGLRAGGVLYRDFLEVNLPGAMWLHAAVRSVLGDASVALRAFDLAAFAAAAWLLARWTGESATSAWRIAAFAFPLLAYFSVSEWCHCQRDVWTLPLALAAAELRRRQALEMAAGHPVSAARAIVEGLLWGLAFWIKPFVVAAGLAAWAAAAAWARPGWRQAWADLAFVVAGGSAVVAAGGVWLVQTGAWPAFVEVMAVWNREYAKPQANLELLQQVAGRLAPWWLAHLAGLPIAVRALGNSARDRRPEALALAVPAALYLGWFAQAMLLQHVWDYVHLPPVLLALGLAAAAAKSPRQRRLLLLAIAAAAAWRSADLVPARWAAWPRCFQEGSAPAVRDALSRSRRLEWSRLAEVEGFLRGADPAPGTVTCLQMETLPINDAMRQPPSTRYLFLAAHLHIFRCHRAEILEDLARCRQQWLVCDLLAFGISQPAAELPADPQALPASWPAARWRGRLAFRSGRYAVFRVAAAEMPAWLAENFDVPKPDPPPRP